jgi:hypothetical protein
MPEMEGGGMIRLSHVVGLAVVAVLTGCSTTIAGHGRLAPEVNVAPSTQSPEEPPRPTDADPEECAYYVLWEEHRARSAPAGDTDVIILTVSNDRLRAEFHVAKGYRLTSLWITPESSEPTGNPAIRTTIRAESEPFTQIAICAVARGAADLAALAAHGAVGGAVAVRRHRLCRRARRCAGWNLPGGHG